MPQDDYTGVWSIDLTSNSTDFPVGKKQKIVLSRDGSSYVLRWQVQGGKEATLSPLFPQPNGVVLSSPAAEGWIEEAYLGTFRVEILLQPALMRLAGSSAQPGLYTTPGQLVGQWGAESTGAGGEEGESQAKPEKPKPSKVTRPAKGGTKAAKSSTSSKK